MSSSLKHRNCHRNLHIQFFNRMRVNMTSSGDIKFGSEKWIDILTEQFASLNALNQCMILCDINSDEDSELVVCDYGDILQSFCSTGHQNCSVKIKIFRGACVTSDITFLDLPVAMLAVHIDTLIPNVPALAIASGACIYFYKNLRPYFKFTFPSLEIDEAEKQAWLDFKNGKISSLNLVESLDELRAHGKLSMMMQRSLQLLEMSDEDERKELAESIKEVPLIRSASISCMTSLGKSSQDEDAISCVVLGLEHGQISIINPETFSVLINYNLESAPVFLNARGLYDVEFTILISCRNGAIYVIKRDTQKPKEFLTFSSHVVGLLRVGKSIIVGTMDDMMKAYNAKGKQLWAVKLPGSILCMEVADLKMRNTQVILVSMNPNDNNENTCGEVRVYLDKRLVDIILMPELVTSMKFGKYAREDDSLVVITSSGMLIVKLLKRTAQFDEKKEVTEVRNSQKLEIPKKTKLFLDNVAREKEFGKEMFNQFQEDLCKLRIDVARKYIDVLDRSMIAVSVDKEAPVKLNIEVTGLGPRFKMSLMVQNTSLTSMCIGLFVTFDWDDSFYFLSNPLLQLPMLIPGVSYTFTTFIECISHQAISNTIKVFVCKANGPPVLTAVVDMPVSEGSFD